MTVDEIARLLEKAIRDHGWIEYGYFPDFKIEKISLVGDELSIEAKLNEHG